MYDYFSLLGSPTPVSSHLLARLRQRGQPRAVIEFVLRHGRETRARGASFFTLHRRDLTRELRRLPLADRASGVVVVVVDGCIQTVYRRGDATRHLRRIRTPRRPRRRVGR